jgi:hypothetical protein
MYHGAVPVRNDPNYLCIARCGEGAKSPSAAQVSQTDAGARSFVPLQILRLASTLALGKDSVPLTQLVFAGGLRLGVLSGCHTISFAEQILPLDLRSAKLCGFREHAVALAKLILTLDLGRAELCRQCAVSLPQAAFALGLWLRLLEGMQCRGQNRRAGEHCDCDAQGCNDCDEVCRTQSNWEEAQPPG